eukprot:CAMPEP_0119088936 /NCGR_PEP_ID=MMETSP1178-20130426/147220_1 /TAXON_ID=33656 /ORGANISM="unid sp, Strain CCMP2000" /LENGTH=41 /DNA_ID= /DNA_START= /DNA_END= /DNA_ORIENTATION=
MLHAKEALASLATSRENAGPAYLSAAHDGASGTATSHQCLQ